MEALADGYIGKRAGRILVEMQERIRFAIKGAELFFPSIPVAARSAQATPIAAAMSARSRASRANFD